MGTHTGSTSHWVEIALWGHTLDQHHTGLRTALWGHTLDQHYTGLTMALWGHTLDQNNIELRVEAG